MQVSRQIVLVLLKTTAFSNAIIFVLGADRLESLTPEDNLYWGRFAQETAESFVVPSTTPTPTSLVVSPTFPIPPIATPVTPTITPTEAPTGPPSLAPTPRTDTPTAPTLSVTCSVEVTAKCVTPDGTDCTEIEIPTDQNECITELQFEYRVTNLSTEYSIDIIGLMRVQNGESMDLTAEIASANPLSPDDMVVVREEVVADVCLDAIIETVVVVAAEVSGGIPCMDEAFNRFSTGNLVGDPTQTVSQQPTNTPSPTNTPLQTMAPSPISTPSASKAPFFSSLPPVTLTAAPTVDSGFPVPIADLSSLPTVMPPVSPVVTPPVVTPTDSPSRVTSSPIFTPGASTAPFLPSVAPFLSTFVPTITGVDPIPTTGSPAPVPTTVIPTTDSPSMVSSPPISTPGASTAPFPPSVPTIILTAVPTITIVDPQPSTVTPVPVQTVDPTNTPTVIPTNSPVILPTEPPTMTTRTPTTLPIENPTIRPSELPTSTSEVASEAPTIIGVDPLTTPPSLGIPIPPGSSSSTPTQVAITVEPTSFVTEAPTFDGIDPSPTPTSPVSNNPLPTPPTSLAPTVSSAPPQSTITAEPTPVVTEAPTIDEDDPLPTLMSPVSLTTAPTIDGIDPSPTPTSPVSINPLPTPPTSLAPTVSSAPPQSTITAEPTPVVTEAPTIDEDDPLPTLLSPVSLTVSPAPIVTTLQPTFTIEPTFIVSDAPTIAPIGPLPTPSTSVAPAEFPPPTETPLPSITAEPTPVATVVPTINGVDPLPTPSSPMSLSVPPAPIGTTPEPTIPIGPTSIVSDAPTIAGVDPPVSPTVSSAPPQATITAEPSSILTGPPTIEGVDPLPTPSVSPTVSPVPSSSTSTPTVTASPAAVEGPSNIPSLSTCNISATVMCEDEEGNPCDFMNPVGQQCIGDKATELRFIYQSDSFCQGNNTQNNFACLDENLNVPRPSTVFIRFFFGDLTFYSGVVSSGNIISVPLYGDNTGVMIEINDLNEDNTPNSLLQSMLLNIECREENGLVLYDTFGALQLTGFRNEELGVRSIFSTATIRNIATNEGMVEAILTGAFKTNPITGMVPLLPDSARIPLAPGDSRSFSDIFNLNLGTLVGMPIEFSLMTTGIAAQTGVECGGFDSFVLFVSP